MTNLSTSANGSDKKKKNLLVIFLFALLVVITSYFIITLFQQPKKQKKKTVKVFEPVSKDFMDTLLKQKEKANISSPYNYEQLIAYADSNFDVKKYLKAKDFYRSALLLKKDHYPIKRLIEIDSLLVIIKESLMRDGKVLVESGSFRMGNDEGDVDEKPSHYVNVRSFYIDQYEVTVYKYRKFCDATKKEMPREPKFGWHDEDPIVNVSYNDALEYAEWCGKRLPTEAEWEFAARGGRKSENYKYSGSNKLDEVAWYWKNSKEKTHPVGLKKPNELKIYDMSGNVWEWTQDWFAEGYYARSSTSNPQGPTTGTKKILRGASWYSLYDYCQVSYRSHGNLDFKYTHIGMRMVWNVENDAKVEELKMKHKILVQPQEDKKKTISQN